MSTIFVFLAYVTFFWRTFKSNPGNRLAPIRTQQKSYSESGWKGQSEGHEWVVARQEVTRKCTKIGLLPYRRSLANYQKKPLASVHSSNRSVPIRALISDCVTFWKFNSSTPHTRSAS